MVCMNDIIYMKRIERGLMTEYSTAGRFNTQADRSLVKEEKREWKRNQVKERHTQQKA